MEGLKSDTYRKEEGRKKRMNSFLVTPKGIYRDLVVVFVKCQGGIYSGPIGL